MDKPTPPLLNDVSWPSFRAIEAFGEAMAAWGAAMEDARLQAEISGLPFEPRDWTVLHKDVIAEMHERREKMAAELAACKEDAERLIYLANNVESDGFGYWLPNVFVKEVIEARPTNDEVRAAIDKARKA